MKCPHCQTEVDEHEANRCLDAWVAEAVMGWQIRNNPDIPSIVEYWDGTLLTGLKYEYWREPPYFSDDIAAAWEVVEKLNDAGYTVDIRNDRVAWSVVFMLDEDKKYTADWKASLFLQICRAALKAAGGE